MSEDDEPAFEFEQGDRLLVRVRENGTSGNIVAKFEGTCDAIYDAQRRVLGPKARIELPWGNFNTVTLRPYEAEFEVIETADEVEETVSDTSLTDGGTN